ncbi:MAG: hypothetical protein M1290_04485 [Candidatus Thermoplasmatota archaeon]|nr:hypothetical protein [Candidatus Thermoplasmatota archaeon]
MESSTKGNDVNSTREQSASGQPMGYGNIEITGAVFAMIVYGIISFVSVAQYSYFYGFHGEAQFGIPFSALFGVLLFLSAYFGSKLRSWAFIIAIILGLVTVITTPLVDGFNSNIPTWDSVLLVAGFLTLYTSFMGLVKVRSLHYRT